MASRAVFSTIYFNARQNDEMRPMGIIFNGISSLLNLAFQMVSAVVLTFSAQHVAFMRERENIIGNYSMTIRSSCHILHPSFLIRYFLSTGFSRYDRHYE